MKKQVFKSLILLFILLFISISWSLVRADILGHIPVRPMTEQETHLPSIIVERYAYITIFTGVGMDWSIVDFSPVKYGRIYFRRMGRNIMHIILGYDGEMLHPLSKPFIIYTDESREYIEYNISAYRTVTVRRKHYQSNNAAKMCKRLLGGQIQCSQHADFSDADTLYVINDLSIPDSILVNSVSPCCYWRYLSHDGSWIGMDAGAATNVLYVRIVPRSNDNDIHLGDVHEIRYCSSDGRWVYPAA
ncbi:MAG TPA: hypothetical protein VFC94_03195 [Bacteroidaceae bacterium]|nr:hypothetical protein [Bacteroidaceae bacterium]